MNEVVDRRHRFEYPASEAAAGTRRLRRTEIELVAEVLLCLDRGFTQTSTILRRANLTYSRFAEIIVTLERRGLVRRAEDLSGRPVYEIEVRGRQFLGQYLDFRRLFESTYGFEL